MSILKSGEIWAVFEEHFAKAFPGGEVAAFSVSIITKDGELAEVGVTREGFVERLEEFDDEEPDGFERAHR